MDGRVLPPESHQLRLALVLNGGVSLAIYMYGVTKELHHLALASAALDRDRAAAGGDQPFTPASRPTGTAGVYYDLLRTVSTPEAPLSVVIDLIAGTSAGGINGVILAKGLAGSLSIDPLEEVWFDKGDIGKLILPDLDEGTHHSRLRTLFANAGRPLAALGNAVLDLLVDRAPLHSNNMSRWILGALTTMDAMPLGDTVGALVPDGETLELQVTTTDLYGYARPVSDQVTGSLPADPTYRQVFHFLHGQNAVAGPRALSLTSDGTPGVNGPLSFAARATSSFPGAFPPITIDGFAEEVNRDGSAPAIDPAAFSEAGFPAYLAADVDPRHREFIDGGVLDNTPFDLVIASIADKEAVSQVTRHIVYVQPAPNPDPLAKNIAANDDAHRRRLGILGTLHHALLSIPRATSMITSLSELEQMNLAIDTTGRVLSNLDAFVESSLDASGASAMGESSAAAGLVATADRMTYLGLRADDERLDVFRAICRRLAIPADSDVAVEIAFALAPVGFGDSGFAYRRRQLQVAIQQVNGELPAASDLATRQALAGWKKDLYAELRALQGALDAALGAPRPGVPSALVPSSLDSDPAWRAPSRLPASAWTEIRDAVVAASEGLSEPALQSTLASVAAGTSPEAGAARRVLRRLEQFDTFDEATLPLTTLARLPQLSPIHATRFSPLDAITLNRHHVLDGSRLGHFAGFFDRKWRKEDYIWGRLTAAEQVVRLVASAVPEGSGKDLDVERYVGRAIGQVFLEEAAVVRTMSSADLEAARALAID